MVNPRLSGCIGKTAHRLIPTRINMLAITVNIPGITQSTVTLGITGPGHRRPNNLGTVLIRLQRQYLRRRRRINNYCIRIAAGLRIGRCANKCTHMVNPRLSGRIGKTIRTFIPTRKNTLTIPVNIPGIT
jgi:hypothetical protein